MARVYITKKKLVISKEISFPERGNGCHEIYRKDSNTTNPGGGRSRTEQSPTRRIDEQRRPQKTPKVACQAFISDFRLGKAIVVSEGIKH